MVWRKTGDAGQFVKVGPRVQILLNMAQHKPDVLLVGRRLPSPLAAGSAARNWLDRSARKVEHFFAHCLICPQHTFFTTRSPYEQI